MTIPVEKRVLSIQSHVVHGYVGNKCSQFTLQANEYEVDAINSVQFSNHTGYNAWKGEVLGDKQLIELYEGLKLNGLNVYSHLLTGYSRSSAFLLSVAEILKDLRVNNKHLIYVCDPVMGDGDAFYVPENILPVYRDVLAPMAGVLTPNEFELHALTGITINSEPDLAKAMNTLHLKGTGRIVVTSTNLCPRSDTIFVYSKDFTGDSILYRFEVPRYPVVFVGTGDLFSSLLLVWWDKKKNLMEAVKSVLSCMHAILDDTYQYAKSRTKGDNKISCADLELRLVTNRKDLLEPKYPIKVVEIV